MIYGRGNIIKVIEKLTNKFDKTVLISFFIVLFMSVLYMLLGKELLSQYKIPVGNTGIYINGMYKFMSGDISAHVDFIGKSLWADAGELILALLAPIYFLFGTNGIWFSYGASIGVSAVLVYLLARFLKINKLASFLLAASVLVNPFFFTNFITSYDPNIYFTPLVIGATYLAYKHYYKSSLLLFIIALTVKDETAIILIFFGLALWLKDKKLKKLGIVVTLTSVCYYIVYSVILSFLSINGASQIALHYSQIGGDNGMVGIIKFAFYNPLLIIKKFFSNIVYLLKTLLPTGFLPLLGSVYLIPLGAALLINMLGNNTGLGSLMTKTNFEFTLLVVPIAILATIDVIKKFSSKYSIILSCLILIISLAYFYHGYVLYVKNSSSWPSSSINAANNLHQELLPNKNNIAFYGQNDTVMHFINFPNTFVVTNNLLSSTVISKNNKQSMVIAYVPGIQNDAAPLRLPKELAALNFQKALKPLQDNKYIHAYWINEKIVIKNKENYVQPTGLKLMNWMWQKNSGYYTVSFNLAPGQYSMHNTSGQTIFINQNNQTKSSIIENHLFTMTGIYTTPVSFSIASNSKYLPNLIIKKLGT